MMTMICPHAGNLPTHLQGWRSHSHPFTLEFLEKVLNFIGLFEVHKAISLILTVLQDQNSPPQVLQRYSLSSPCYTRRVNSNAHHVSSDLPLLLLFL